jgi:hypothetical protein
LSHLLEEFFEPSQFEGSKPASNGGEMRDVVRKSDFLDLAGVYEISPQVTEELQASNGHEKQGNDAFLWWITFSARCLSSADPEAADPSF